MLTKRIIETVPGITKSGNGWYYFPTCLACGKSKKMCFKDPVGYKCWSANCGIRGTMIDLVKMLRHNGYSISIQSSDVFVSDVKVDVQAKDNIVDFDVPAETKKITSTNMPVYLTRGRAFKPSTILRFGMGYCESGFYRGRIIIPVHSGRRRAFIAYSTNTSRILPKVMYPKGSRTSDMLFPYNYVSAKSPTSIVIVEGVMDALRVLEHKHHALPLALLGCEISMAQIWLLWDLVVKRTKDITICLDADATAKAERVARRISTVIGYNNIYSMSLANLTGNTKENVARTNRELKCVDPDDIRSAKDWGTLYDERKSLYWIANNIA